MVLQVLLDWTIYSGVPARSVLHYDDDTEPADALAALQAAFTPSRLNTFNNQTKVQVDPTWRSLNTETGELQLLGTFSSPTIFSGGNSSVPVPDAAQGLVALKTGSIVGGRLLAGRVFFPGIASGNTAAGNLSPSSAADLAALVNSFSSASAQLVVWSRPKPGTPGSVGAVTGATGRTEMAVLRRRRNR